MNDVDQLVIETVKFIRGHEIIYFKVDVSILLVAHELFYSFQKIKSAKLSRPCFIIHLHVIRIECKLLRSGGGSPSRFYTSIRV